MALPPGESAIERGSRPGLAALIEGYLGALDNRRALESLAGFNQAGVRRYRALCGSEDEAAAEILLIAAEGDDIAGILVSVLRERARARGLAPTPRRAGYPAGTVETMRSLIGGSAGTAGPPRGPAGDEVEDEADGLVMATGAAIHSAPDHGAPVITHLAPGTPVEVISRTDSWVRLEEDQDGPAYVHSSLVDLFEEERDPVPGGYVKIQDQKPTFYNTAREEGFPTKGPLHGHDYNGSETRSILAVSGSRIATTSGRFFAHLLMEGSGILEDGRAVSYVSNKRFQLIPVGSKGITATGNWVVPFHTLAVNKREMPYNGVYFIPKSKGLILPTGEEHDGFWFAHDTGGAFQGTPRHRIDLYVDQLEWVMWMETNFVPSFTPLEVYRVDRDTERQVYEKYRAALGRPPRQIAVAP
jgi:3D (Asp-Asp-Asp) domain-containing protein